MKKYTLKELDAGVLSSAFSQYDTPVPMIKGLIDLFANIEEYSKNPELIAKNHPDWVFSGRLTKVVADRIISPLVIISDKLEYMDKKQLTNIVKFNVNLFTAYLLQSLKILANIYGVDMSMLARQVTDKKLYKAAAKAVKTVANKMATEATKVVEEGLESAEEGYINTLIKKHVEDKFKPLAAGIEANKSSNEVKFETADQSHLGISESVIKIVDVTLKVSKQIGDETVETKVTLPFIIAPVILFTNADTFLRAVLGNNEAESLQQRWLELRSGAISFWDFITGSDLIKQYKRNRIQNENDVVKLIQKRLRTNALSSLVSGEGGFTAFNNIYIFAKEDEATIEDIIKDDLLDPEVWQQLALDLFAFDINIVDTEKELVINFITDMPTYSVLTFKQLLKESNKSDDELLELVKTMLLNKPPF